MPEPVIRLDRSKPFSTCHGERTPDDPHYRVHFWQGGRFGKDNILLPFDSNGELIADDGKTEAYQGSGIDPQGKSAIVSYLPLYTEKMRAFLKAKKDRATASQVSNEPTIEEDEQDVAGQSAPEDDVNLESWLRGEVKYQPHQLRAAAKKRYHKTYANIPELIADLVLDEKLVPEDKVAPHLAKFLPKKEAA